MNKLNSIFMETDQLTNKELEQYLTGKLNKAEQHRIELIIAANPLLAEAVEGYESVGKGLAGFNELSTRFHSNVGTSGTGSSGSTLTGSWISAIIFTSITVGSIGLINENLNNSTSTVNHLISIAEQTEEPVEEVTDQEITAELDAELVSAEPIEQQEVITYTKARENQPLTVESTQNSTSEPNPEITASNQLAIEKVNIPKPEEINLETTVISNSQIRYAHDLKLVDLDVRHDWRIRVRNLEEINTGLRAYSAHYDIRHHRTNNPQTFVDPYTYVHYDNFLDSAVYLFTTNNYRSALKAFSIVISQFPDDVNAHYYGALCYYNLGKPQKAIKYFDFVLSSDINSFDQEAEFYKALSLKQAGYPEYAKDLFNKIVHEGKFYAKRAKVELANF